MLRKMIQVFILMFLFLHLSQGVIEKGKLVRLSHQDRWQIMDYHNDLRGQVPAADMQELIWDRDAARAARIWVKRCTFDLQRRPAYSENLFYNAKVSEPAGEVLMDAMQNWAQEADRNTSRRLCGRSFRCNYLKIITAKVTSVGCAIARCPVLHVGKFRRETEVNFVACLYSPKIDVSLAEPYREGLPCTHCKSGYSCRNHLCSPPLIPNLPLKFEDEYDSTLKSEDVKYHRKYNEVVSKTPTVDINVDINNRPHRNRTTEGRQPVLPPNSLIPGQGGLHGEDRLNRENNHAHREILNGTFLDVDEFGTGNDPTTGRRAELRGSRQQKIYGHNRGRKEGRENGNLSRMRHRNRVKRQTTWNSRDPYSVSRRRYLEQRRQREREIQRRERERSLRERERRRRRQEEERRRRQPSPYRREAGELTQNEEAYLLQMHNTIRTDGLPKLTWDSYMEKWARYVIRCHTEYPGPIYTYTNFGKIAQNEPVYQVVYDWSSEGSDIYQDLKTGCRTPYDRSRCNHNTVMKARSIRQIGCAALICDSNRNIVCIYR